MKLYSIIFASATVLVLLFIFHVIVILLQKLLILSRVGYRDRCWHCDLQDFLCGNQNSIYYQFMRNSSQCNFWEIV